MAPFLINLLPFQLVKLGLPTESGEVRFTPCFDPVRDGYSVRSLPGNPRVTFFTHGASLGGIQRLVSYYNHYHSLR